MAWRGKLGQGEAGEVSIEMRLGWLGCGLVRPVEARVWLGAACRGMAGLGEVWEVSKL
jgi:hypothetical protein